MGQSRHAPLPAAPPLAFIAAIPALPVRDVRAAVTLYRERFGFEARHEDAGFAVLARDDAVLHRASAGGVTVTDFGTREFATLDGDGNLLSFFRRETE